MASVGIVCEGTTDFPVLRQVVIGVFGPATEVALLQPRTDMLRGKSNAPGWQGVRAFCASAVAHVASAHDVLVFHVDADVRDKVGQQLEAADDDEDLTPLCRHVKTWLGGWSPIFPGARSAVAPGLVSVL
jgi:hypothetical protein